MSLRETAEAGPEEPEGVPTPPGRKIFGIHPLKVVFAMEYVLQGLANPFQGVTYQPFFRHFSKDYGLSEAATQGYFAKSYLAWSFKPVIGFLIDAYGRTRTLLIALLSAATLGYFLTPVIDTGALVFFAFMFGLSVVLAATDVSVDRATVIAGEEEAQATGRSRSTTVGLNQAICWTAIYGTGIVAALSGGWIADHVEFDFLMIGLGLVPLALLAVVLMLPRDRATPIPLTKSVAGFWNGLHSGPILGVMLFYFLFHFQPALGALWTNYQIETLEFSQTQLGISDAAASAGLFLGVLLFAWKGVRWQEGLGLRRMFRIYIFASIVLNLTSYLLVDPLFSSVTGGLHRILPFLDESTVRVGYLSANNFVFAIAASLIRMSTFSLVGAVIPVAAAGSLFAGFMSVANLAYSFSYSSGAWLYEHGMGFAPLRSVQEAIFGIAGGPGDELSISMLILIGSVAYVLSFAAIRFIPDVRQTRSTGAEADRWPGPERWRALPAGTKKTVDGIALVAGLALTLGGWFALGMDPVSPVLISFFGVVMIRQAVLDFLLRRRPGAITG